MIVMYYRKKAISVSIFNYVKLVTFYIVIDFIFSLSNPVGLFIYLITNLIYKLVNFYARIISLLQRISLSNRREQS